MMIQLHAALKNGIYVLCSKEIVSFDFEGVKCKKEIGTIVSDMNTTVSSLMFPAGPVRSKICLFRVFGVKKNS